MIIDAVIHAYNFAPENARNATAVSFANASYGRIGLTGDSHLISNEQYARDWTIDELAQLVFVESDVDLAAFHAVPLDDYFVDGFVSNAKGIEMRRRWPNRVLFYGAVNPLAGPSAVDEAEHLVTECGASGIKLYPERFVEGAGATPVRLDDPATEPLLCTLSELGVPVAVHKFAPAGKGNVEHYRTGDVEMAAARHPELQIEVVHAGVAFLDETLFLLARYENVWANLESTTSLAVRYPRRFAEAFGTLLASGATDRLLFATGAALLHPQPVIQALRDFTMPRALVEDYGYPEITPEMMNGFLGENYARLHSIDLERARDAIADDEFARRRAAFSGPRWSAATTPVRPR